jgi:hypothetical protein
MKTLLKLTTLKLEHVAMMALVGILSVAIIACSNKAALQAQVLGK